MGNCESCATCKKDDESNQDIPIIRDESYTKSKSNQSKKKKKKKQ